MALKTEGCMDCKQNIAYPKRVLISYLESYSIAYQLQESFEKLGIETELIITCQINHWFYKRIIKPINKFARNLRIVKKGYDFFPKHPLNRLNYLSSTFKKKYETFSPDLVLFIHGIAYANDVLAEIDVPKIGWWTEPYDDISLLRINAKPFDLYNSFSQSAVELLKNERFPVRYLCHAFNPKSFYLIDNYLQNIDVVFVGNWSPWREAVIKKILGVTKNISLYGPGWKRKSTISSEDLKVIYKGDKIVGPELNQLFNSARIVVNASRNYGSSGLNMRFFEVLASGACPLTDWVPELEKHFTPEQHLSMFLGLDDLVLRVNQLLDDIDLRNNIRENGHNHIVEKHTYDKLAKQFIKQYDLICKNN